MREREPLNGKEKSGNSIFIRLPRAVAMAVCICASALFLGGCQSHSKEQIELRLKGIEQLQAGDYEAAVDSFKQVLEDGKGVVGEFELDVLKYRGEAEYRAGDYEAAAYTYDVLAQVDEERTEYLSRSVIFHAMAGHTDQALEKYTRLYELEPDKSETADALLSLGQAFIEKDRISEALELFEKAVNDGIASGKLYNEMAVCLLEDGELDRALEYLEQGIAAGDETVMQELLVNKAAVYEKKLDFAKALEILQQCASSYGTTPEIDKEIAFLKTR